MVIESSKIELQFAKFSTLRNWSVQSLLLNNFSYNQNYTVKRIGDFLNRDKSPIEIKDSEFYKRITIKTNNGGVFLRDSIQGKYIGTKKQFVVKTGQFILSKIDARNGAFGVIPKELDGAIITGNFWTFNVDYSTINPHFLALIVTTSQFVDFCNKSSTGTTNRHYLQENLFLDVKIPVPSLEEQSKIVKDYNEKIFEADSNENRINNIEDDIQSYLFNKLGIIKVEISKKNKLFEFTRFKNLLNRWSIDVFNEYKENDNFNVVTFEKNPNLLLDAFRGKSPKYAKSDTLILNQRCVRWNYVNKEFAKTVDISWAKNVDDKFKTRNNDILINSTGEGTIGRSSLVDKQSLGMLTDSHILTIRINENEISPTFFIELFNSDYIQKQIDNIKSAQSTNQTELGLNNLMRIRFPLPSITVQNSIVENLKAKREEMNSLDEKLNKLRDVAIKEFEETIFN